MLGYRSGEGFDVWDKVRAKVKPKAAQAQGASAAVRPKEKPPRRPPPIDPMPLPMADRDRPRPPPVPAPRGKREWWMNDKAPPQWQRGTGRASRWQGEDQTNAYEVGREDPKRYIDAAYRAGLHGDEGAADGFPPGPVGDQMRRAYRDGMRARQGR